MEEFRIVSEAIFSFGITGGVVGSLMNVAEADSTTRSALGLGVVAEPNRPEIAIRRPAMKFPIVRCAAKPTTIPITTEEARIPAATAHCGITSLAQAPTKMITVVALRRRTRARDRLRRQVAAGEASGRRGATTRIAIRTAPNTLMRSQSGMSHA
jgi:hypothetical protein